MEVVLAWLAVLAGIESEYGMSRFPDSQVASTQHNRAKERCEYLTDLAAVNPAPVVRQWLRRAEWELGYWEELGNAHANCWWLGPRSFWLSRLKERVGERAFYAGWHPPIYSR